jgi:hypothetical protein
MTGKHRAGPRPRRETETSDFVGMLHRMFIAYGDRIAEDPAALAHLRDLEDAWRDAVNTGIFRANQGEGKYSTPEIGRILGVSHQAIGKRAGLGRTAHAALVARRGGGALVRLADLRARRAELLEQAGVEDRTGSERERGALRRVV